MAENYGFGSAIVTGAIIGYLFFASPVTTYHVVQLYCTSSLDDDDNCDSVAKVGSELSVSINRTTQVLQVNVLNNDGNYPSKYFYRNDCSVLDGQNWRCSDYERHASPDAIVEVFGMDAGVFYSSVTSDEPPNYYNSSVSWIPYQLYNHQLVTLESAIWLSHRL